MREVMRKIDVARAAGVNPAAITKSIQRGALRQALTPDGRRLFRDHPAVRAYIEENRTGRQAAASPRRSAAARLPVVDPFATAFDLATVTPPGVSGKGSAAAAHPTVVDPDVVPLAPPPSFRPDPLRAGLYELQTAAAGQLPNDLDDLGDMTMRELVTNHGTLRGLLDAVKASQAFADMRNKQGITAKRRGALIDREIVGAVIVPFIEQAFKRLVTEAPTALTGQIVARVLAGGEDLKIDVERMIRTENGKILTNCRDSVAKELGKLAAEAV